MSAPGHILLIEDDELYARLLVETLQEEGFACSEARCRGEATRLLEAGAYDLVITDLYLTGEAGTSTLDLIAAGPWRDVPVIVITGSPSVDNAMQSLDLRVFAFRPKPLAMPELVGLVHQAVREARIRRRLGATRERLRALDAQLSSLREITRSQAEENLDQSLAEYILLLLGNCGENLAEIIETFRLMNQGSLYRPVRQLSRHPEAEMFRQAIEHTVQVLERTKHSFKSRELADLRKQLETALAVTKPD